jgi:hypothetical protein
MGLIGQPTLKSVDGGENWSEEGTPLGSGSIYFAYPLFFKHQGQWYMTPHNQPREFRIYELSDDLNSLTLVETVTDISEDVNNPTTIRYNGRWWVIFNDVNSDIRVYYSDKGDELVGRGWTPHPSNPVHTSSSDNVTGMAGRPIVGPKPYHSLPPRR